MIDILSYFPWISECASKYTYRYNGIFLIIYLTLLKTFLLTDLKVLKDFGNLRRATTQEMERNSVLSD